MNTLGVKKNSSVQTLCQNEVDWCRRPFSALSLRFGTKFAKSTQDRHLQAVDICDDGCCEEQGYAYPAISCKKLMLSFYRRLSLDGLHPWNHIGIRFASHSEQQLWSTHVENWDKSLVWNFMCVHTTGSWFHRLVQRQCRMRQGMLDQPRSLYRYFLQNQRHVLCHAGASKEKRTSRAWRGNLAALGKRRSNVGCRIVRTRLDWLLVL